MDFPSHVRPIFLTRVRFLQSWAGIYIRIYIYICMYIYVYIYIYIDVYIYMRVCMSMCACTYIYIYACVYEYVCVYVYLRPKKGKLTQVSGTSSTHGGDHTY